MLLAFIACSNPCWYSFSPGECRFSQVKAAWEQHDEAGTEAALQQISDPLERELALVRLAILSPSEAPQLCKRVTQAVAKQKCQQILGRPHLQDVKRP
jgi:hypothetical protein